MFTTRNFALKKMAALSESNPNVKAKYGSHLAKATLTTTHGVSSATGKHGHFTFYPRQAIKLEAVFTAVEALP